MTARGSLSAPCLLAALVVLVALAALGAGPAAAQPVDDREKAASHFRQGQAYYKRDDFDRAIVEYQAAFDLSKEPSLIFNIALCHDRAKRPEQALELYRRYLELAPGGDVAEEAREEVARLTPVVEKIVADREAARKAEAQARRERELEELRRRPKPPQSRVPWIVMGAGAAVAVVGATFHVMSWQTRNDLEAPPDLDTYYVDRDTFRFRRAVSISAYAVGAAALLTGLILRPVLHVDHEVKLSAQVAPGAALVTVGWSR